MKITLIALLALLGCTMNGHAAEKLVDLTKDQFANAELVPGGQKFSLDLGTSRMDWPHNRWSQLKFDGAKDLSKFNALRVTIKSEKSRRDVGISVALQEADGSWYYVNWAVDLTQKENVGIARFADMAQPLYSFPTGAGGWSDSNRGFDPDQVTAIAIGIINPMGVGEVDFTVTSIEAVSVEAPDLTKAANITATGRLLDINGTTLIPNGVFGSFNLAKGHTEKYRLHVNRSIFHDGLSGGPNYGPAGVPMWVNTIGDRVRTSNRLTHGDWKQRNENFGTSFGKKAAEAHEAGKTTYVEYWNEPYLNWANSNRANFITQYYDESKAKEGGPVHIKHDGELAPHLIWTKDSEYVGGDNGWLLGYYARRFGRDKDHWMRGRDEKGKVYSTIAEPYNNGMAFLYGGKWEPQSHPPKGTKEGGTYQYKGKTLTAFTPWYVVDTTQHAYRSGKGMLKMYIDPMLAFGQHVKKEAPETVFIAGWGTRPSEDNWSYWPIYTATIDADPQLVDGIGDHDYGGSPIRMPAVYEVVTAYGVTAHDKWLYSYNTETASSTDPQVYRDVATASQDLGKFQWTAEKLLYTLQYTPDKARCFMWFGMGGGFWSDQGEGVVMEMLMTLRGRLVEINTDHPEILAVASIDGTDPEIPQTEATGEGPTYTVAIFNQANAPRKIKLDAALPTGYRARLGSSVTIRVNTLDEKGQPAITTLDAIPAELDPGQLLVITTPILGEAGAPGVIVRQSFMKQQVVQVTPDAPQQDTVSFDADLLKNVERVRVRLVAEHLNEGEAELVLNGTVIPLPSCVTAANTPALRVFEIDPKLLKASNSLTVRTTAAHHPGFLLAALSLEVTAGR